ncbi:hypothetical protein BASA81_015862 [Batrachochytrium salamandrivorans]|nr:hypothetical protein BASA81_015862 [Batrachochytrium salamandrivorans]
MFFVRGSAISPVDGLSKRLGESNRRPCPLRSRSPERSSLLSQKEEGEVLFELVRSNLPPSVLIQTPFGFRRVVYADYTASGRSLRCIELYMTDVVAPLFANTHTEASATGLQTGAFREEARQIVMDSLHAPQDEYTLIFAGSGATAAMAKLIAILGLKLSGQLSKYCTLPVQDRALVLITSQEHHSNELMWRETNTCDVVVVPLVPSVGVMDLEALEAVLKQATQVEKRKLIIGSFSAGSNVTGIRNDPEPITNLMHRYGAYACFDFAGAGPYVDIDMAQCGMDAVFLSPHKFVGGPGTPGVLCARTSFLCCTGASELPPSVPGGGTVTMVWGGLDGILPGVMYDAKMAAREEAGTPAILESIRCGLVFSLRNQVGAHRIEAREALFAQRAVKRFQLHGNIAVMGEQYAAMHSSTRLSITSFTIQCALPGQAKWRLNHHFVSALLNDVYGIQSRSGCSCAGPYGMRLFQLTEHEIMAYQKLITQGITGANLGWARINFNYFITEQEFDFLCTAVEQIATHGWKLLPMYSICMETGLWSYTGQGFSRLTGMRSLQELQLLGASPNKLVLGTQPLESILRDALQLYAKAPQLVRENLPNMQNFTSSNVLPSWEHVKFFPLPSEVVQYLI